MKTKIIACRTCGKTFEVPFTSKRYLCDDCKRLSQKNHFKYVIEQKVLCRHSDCNNVVKINIKKGTGAKEYIRGVECCDYHKNHPYEIVKQTVLCPRCNKVIEVKEVKKYHQTKLQKISHTLCQSCHIEVLAENTKKASERLSKQNPMFQVESVQKMKKTLQEHIKNGSVQYKRGADHWLFKGNRQFNLEVRSRLYPIWIYPILQRDNFTCQKCGKKTELQVHHLRPLSNICDIVFKQLGISNTSTLITREDLGTEQYEKALEAVLAEHSLEDGITVCKDCHKLIDYYYRPIKGEHKNK